MDEPKTSVIGRPTLYKPEYCEQLVEHMGKGLSFESFAGKIGVNRDTLYEWAKVQPDFSDAKKKGESACLYWWEVAGNNGLWGSTRDGMFNTGVYVFNMKNRFRWTDKLEIQGGEESKPIQLSYKL